LKFRAVSEKNMSGDLINEVNKFRQWAEKYPENSRYGEWECDYDDWTAIYGAFSLFISNRDVSSLSQAEIDDLIYIIARDNEIEYLIKVLASRPDWIEALLSQVIHCNEPDAKWQFAVILGQDVLDKRISEPTLLILVEDENEYVSRRSLQALGNLKSNFVEALCERAWNSGDEYQRIMALWVLKEISSSQLSAYLALAKKDGRNYLLHNAAEIENIKPEWEG
jgi:hypothetical protein